VRYLVTVGEKESNFESVIGGFTSRVYLRVDLIKYNRPIICGGDEHDIGDIASVVYILIGKVVY
jgi:hypothetical protein